MPIDDRGSDLPQRVEPRAATIRKVVLTLSAILTLIGMFWIARSFRVDGRLHFGNPTAPTPLEADSSDPQPRQIRAEVTRVRGAQIVRPGDKCEFLVERRVRDHDSYYCNAQVVCGGRLLFGGPDRGYFPCRLFDSEHRDVIGSDPNTTSADRDAAILINTREGVMRIWDDERGVLGEFQVEADILSIQ